MTDIEKQVCNETIFTKSCKPGRDFLHTCKSWLSLQTLTYNDILWVVWTHPAVGWERS